MTAMAKRKAAHEIRPDLDGITDSETFRDWYWLKAELIAFSQRHGLRSNGSKAELAERIAHYLETGEHTAPEARPRHARRRPKSRVDWARLEITPETVITDSYTNGPNVRAFFEAQIGPRFRFNIAFMDWMRRNDGKTMAEATDAWLEIERLRKSGVKAPIPDSNLYNRYLRDFFSANPGRSMAEARACWQAKRHRPGSNLYEAEDLDLLDPPQP